MKAVSIMSGGMDSVTLAYFLKQTYEDLTLVSFNYGQRHKKELEYAVIQANLLKAKHQIIDISGIKPLLKGSVKRRCPNISKLLKIGYKNNNNYLTGLRQTVLWYKKILTK